MAKDLYERDLAEVHHAHFGMVAEGAATVLLEALAAQGIGEGTVVDLAGGSGILSARLLAAGYDVVTVDISEQMLAIARGVADGAAFIRASLWDVALPPCHAVAAVGEAFCYVAGDDAPSLARLETRFADIREALAPGGVLLFDVAGPGRSGPEGLRRLRWEHGTTCLFMEEHERDDRLERRIDQFTLTEGGLYRRALETHHLVLHDPEMVQGALTRAGFADVAPLEGYGDFAFPPGWRGFVAMRTRPRPPA